MAEDAPGPNRAGGGGVPGSWSKRRWPAAAWAPPERDWFAWWRVPELRPCPPEAGPAAWAERQLRLTAFILAAQTRPPCHRSAAPGSELGRLFHRIVDAGPHRAAAAGGAASPQAPASLRSPGLVR